jgi:hypothetical protein
MMRIKLALIVAACLSVFSMALSTSAHHSFASEFSLKKPIMMTGTVTNLDWVNPHCYMQLDVKDDSGNVDRWKFEFGAPVGLRRAGMRQDMLAPGQVVTINGYAAKDNTKLGWVSKFTFPDGRVITITPDAKDAPPNP